MDADPKLTRDYVRERGLAESRRSREQNVIEYLAALARRLDRHAEHALGTRLPNKFVERLRAQRLIEAPIFFDLGRRREFGGTLRAGPRVFTFHQTAPPMTFAL
jgi:hypothetical protein